MPIKTVYGGIEPHMFCPNCNNGKLRITTTNKSKLFNTITRYVTCQNCGYQFKFVTDMPTPAYT